MGRDLGNLWEPFGSLRVPFGDHWRFIPHLLVHSGPLGRCDHQQASISRVPGPRPLAKGPGTRGPIQGIVFACLAPDFPMFCHLRLLCPFYPVNQALAPYDYSVPFQYQQGNQKTGFSFGVFLFFVYGFAGIPVPI